MAVKNKKAIAFQQWLPGLDAGQIIFMEKPGYAIITEGVHDLSVDSMNTSFSLVSAKDT